MAVKSSSRPILKNTTRPENRIKKQNWDTLRAFHQIAKQKTKEYGYGTGIGALSDKRFLKKVIGPMMQNSPQLRTDEDIRDAVELWCTDPVACEAQYGHISEWDVSNVVNMYSLFDNKKEFNDDISRWDVSNVVHMGFMFTNAHKFNQPIGSWNVSNVTTMICMFMDAHSFNQPIGNWNVSKVGNMDSMFENASAFDQNLNNWPVQLFMPREHIFNGSKMSGDNTPNKWSFFRRTPFGGAKKNKSASRKRSRRGTRSRKGRRTMKRGTRRSTHKR
jgi:surface protein